MKFIISSNVCINFMHVSVHDLYCLAHPGNLLTGGARSSQGSNLRFNNFSQLDRAAYLPDHAVPVSSLPREQPSGWHETAGSIRVRLANGPRSVTHHLKYA